MALTLGWDGNIDITGKFMQNGQEVGVGSGEGGTVNSIEKIEFTSSTDGDTAGIAGATDTYTITFTDNSTSTFNVYNGVDGEQGIQGEEGEVGIGIENIIWSSTNGETGMPNEPGATDTYTIYFTDGNTTTFDVYNGMDGSASDPLSAIEISITVSEYGTDDENISVFSNPVYNTIAFAMLQAENAGIRNLVINLEGNINETLEFINYYNNIKICRLQPDTAVTTTLYFSHFDVSNGGTVIIEDPRLTISFMGQDVLENVAAFGNVLIKGTNDEAEEGSDPSSFVTFENNLNITDGGNFIIEDCTLLMNDAQLVITNGSKCSLVGCTWDEANTMQNCLSISNGAILTSNNNATQQYILNSSLNSGLVVINNQLVPH